MLQLIGDYSPAIFIPRVVNFLETMWVYPRFECCLFLLIYGVFLRHIFHLEQVPWLFFFYPLQMARVYKEVVWEYHDVLVVVLSLVIVWPS